MFSSGDNDRLVPDRGLRVRVGGVFVAKVFNGLFQLAFMSVLESPLVGNTARLRRRINWGNDGGIWAGNFRPLNLSPGAGFDSVPSQ